jgi:hypothetical protein
VVGAAYDSPSASRGCLAGTRVTVLATLATWVQDEAAGRIFWLSGLAGTGVLLVPTTFRSYLNLVTGKSTVSKSFATDAHRNGANVISFFLARDVADRNKAANIIHSLAYQLAIAAPGARSVILAAVKDDPLLVDAELEERVQKLLLDPLKGLPAQHSPIVFVVDALDECSESDRKNFQRTLVVLLRGICALPGSARVKLFITSRAAHWIQRAFDTALSSEIRHLQSLRLHELDQGEVERDIRAYFEDAFAQIRCEHPDGDSLGDWPSAEQKKRLVEKTGVLFVFASAVVLFVSGDGLSPRTKLDEVLCDDSPSGDLDNPDGSPFKQLDDLYSKVLQGSLASGSHAPIIHQVAATVILAALPLTINTLSEIIGQDVNAVVRSLSSVLLVPERSLASKEPVRAFHRSLHDFLTDTSRCTDKRFAVDPSTEHGRFATRCFNQMYKTLKKDICDIRDPFLLNRDVPNLNDRVTQRIPVGARYACLYWHFHLHRVSSPNPALLAFYVSFCRERIVFWVEAMSLLGELGSARNALLDLQRSRQVRPIGGSPQPLLIAASDSSRQCNRGACRRCREDGFAALGSDSSQRTTRVSQRSRNNPQMQVAGG